MRNSRNVGRLEARGKESTKVTPVSDGGARHLRENCKKYYSARVEISENDSKTQS